MCYGSLDPKYVTRDLDARVKSLSWTADTEKEAAQPVRGGVMARLRAVWARIRRKELRHV
jgi:hypothetical protein